MISTREVAEQKDNDLAYSIVEQMGLGFKVRNCSCGQLPCARLRPIVDALRQREEEVRAEGWLPIESAPKGRKLIVGYFNPLGNWRSVMGCYYLDGTLESETDESGFAPEGWYEETQAYEYLMPMDQEPTYYRLLPPPPAIRRDSAAQERQ